MTIELRHRKVLPALPGAVLERPPRQGKRWRLTLLLLACVMVAVGTVVIVVRWWSAADTREPPRADFYRSEGPFTIPLDEQGDVFLRRPDWRRRQQRQQQQQQEGRPPSHDRAGAAGAMDPAEKEEEVRVLILITGTRLTDYVCTAVGTAYLAGLPVVVAGYGDDYRSYEDKPRLAASVARNAGLHPHDVVLVLDSDVLFSLGADLVRALDRFILLSPASPAELDARAVRGGAGRMLAPVIVSGEANCWLLYLLRTNDVPRCQARYREGGEWAFELYAAKEFAENFTAYRHYTFRYPNSGMFVARVWAYAEYQAAYERFIAASDRVNHRLQRTVFYRDDQSAVGGLYLSLLAWEASAEMLSVANQGRARTARHPYGLRAGSLAMDYANEFASVVVTGEYDALRLDDRRWRRRRLSSAGGGEPVPRGTAASASPAGLLGGHSPTDVWPPHGAVTEGRAGYFHSPLDGTRAEAAARQPAHSLVNRLPITNSTRRNACHITALLRAHAERGGRLPTAPPVASAHTPPVDPAWALHCDEAQVTAASVLAVYTTHPVPRSRAANTMTLASVAPLVAVTPFLEDTPAPHTAGKRRTRGEPRVVFPSILHMAGLRKAAQTELLLPLLPWAVPIFSDPRPRSDPQSALARARAYLAGMPLELWSTKRRQRGSFGEQCLPRLTWLAM